MPQPQGPPFGNTVAPHLLNIAGFIALLPWLVGGVRWFRAKEVETCRCLKRKPGAFLRQTQDTKSEFGP